MAISHPLRTVKLGLLLLEQREVPAALTAASELAVDHSAYDLSHLLVKWRDGNAHTTPVSVAAESLGGGTYRLTLKGTDSVQSALNYFRGRSDIEFAQPDYQVHFTRLPNDPSFGSLWGLNNTGQSSGTPLADIDATGAWNYNTGSGNTIVAVIDSGIDYNHPDLAANIWHNPGEVAGNGKDDDRDGYTDDVYGWNFVSNSGNVMDDNGHGTHVAGTIGAVGDNGIGVTGINWHVKIMALKFLDQDGSGYMSNAVKALNYAVAHGAKVVNNSYGGGGSDPAMSAAIENARSKGVIFVAAAGNDGTNNDVDPVYPANYASNNVVTVAATDRNDRLASFSNYGRTTVDLAAPGVSILSTLPGNRYGTYSGTSMATPHVVGALALVWDAHPTWTYRQVIDAVLNSTDPSASLSGKVATGGRLDVKKAITYGSAPTVSNPTIVSVTFPGGTGSLSKARVTFSEAMNVASFTASDVTLTGPNGRAIAVSSVLVVPGTSNRQFEISFATQTTSGNYLLKIGSDISSATGKKLDQNQNGITNELSDSYSTTTSLTASRQFVSSDIGKAINDYGRTVSVINVSQAMTIRDINVAMNISHTYVGDLKVSLIGPDGTRIVLVNRRGGSGNDFSTTVFDDEASKTIVTGTAPFNGSYRPESALSVFDGKSAKGNWQLVVEDQALLDTGRLTGWSITINTVGSTSLNSQSNNTVANGVQPVSAKSNLDLSGLWDQPETNRKHTTRESAEPYFVGINTHQQIRVSH